MEVKDVFRFRGLSPPPFFLFEPFEFKMSLTLRLKEKSLWRLMPSSWNMMVGRTPEVAYKKYSALLSLNKLQFFLAVDIIAVSFICERQVFPFHVVWRPPTTSLLSLYSFPVKLAVWAVGPELYVAFALWFYCEYVDPSFQ